MEAYNKKLIIEEKDLLIQEYINICRRWMKTAFTSYRYRINRAHKKFRIKLNHMLLQKILCYDVRSIIMSYII